ncbi:hypothetical protein [Anaerostipes butyraticus]|uniref:hypothetical protein n=1 Tax=Anaerostipes butyraticus TaxID=645466 RepID=UPI0023A79B4A|nr:hypothetical protein [Anaerostipes butyraticus]
MLFAIIMTIGFAYGIFVVFLPVLAWYQQKKIWKMEEKITRMEKIINLLSNDKYKDNAEVENEEIDEENASEE